MYFLRFYFQLFKQTKVILLEHTNINIKRLTLKAKAPSSTVPITLPQVVSTITACSNGESGSSSKSDPLAVSLSFFRVVLIWFRLWLYLFKNTKESPQTMNTIVAQTAQTYRYRERFHNNILSKNVLFFSVILCRLWRHRRSECLSKSSSPITLRKDRLSVEFIASRNPVLQKI